MKRSMRASGLLVGLCGFVSLLVGLVQPATAADLTTIEATIVDNAHDAATVAEAGFVHTIFIQDHDRCGCDGALVYDTMGGARRAYIVQCNEWEYWMTLTPPTVGPQSWLGNPMTNVYQQGIRSFQLFQGGYIRTGEFGSYSNATVVQPYPYDFAPGQMADGSWNPRISYRFAEAYEIRGAHKWLGFPRSGVETMSGDVIDVVSCAADADAGRRNDDAASNVDHRDRERSDGEERGIAYCQTFRSAALLFDPHAQTFTEIPPQSCGELTSRAIGPDDPTTLAEVIVLRGWRERIQRRIQRLVVSK